MSRHEPRPLSRREAERLLDDPAAADGAVASVLRDAQAPTPAGSPLAREETTVAAFRAARLTAPGSRSQFVSPSTPGRRAATKAVVATGAVVAMISGGFAMAATGHLPSLPDQASERATEAVAQTRTPSETASTSASASASTSATTESSSSTSEESESASATPTPNFKGLCKAFQASDKSAHGKALESAAFTALATEAGGPALVATYCVALVGEPRETGRPTDKPTPTTGKPTDKPTPGKPTDKPTPTTGKPSDKPTPTTGKPTDKPAPGTKGQSSGSKRER